MRNEASFAGIFAELSSLLSGAGRYFALYTLVIGGLTSVGVVTGLAETTSGSLNFGFELTAADSLGSALFKIGSGTVSIVATYLLLTRYLAAGGRRVAGNRFWQYLGTAILSGLAVALGIVLLIVPGVILLVRWSAASGFVIGAGQSISESLTSSWNATKGHGWAIFFSAVVLFLGLIMGGGVVGLVFSAMGETIVGVASAFVEAVASAVFAAYGIAIYRLVHDEGNEISEVFA